MPALRLHPGFGFMLALVGLILGGAPGSTTSVHEITRQILGYQDRASTSESGLVVTATIQN
ncbi:MAG TPA: hypothetical protein VGK77_24840 [Candidatus Binatia bacterium]|jgi:hypothetical protein